MTDNEVFKTAVLQQSEAHVELFTHENHYRATVFTQGRRLLDELNDHTTDYLIINDVDVYRYGEKAEAAVSFPEAIIYKQDLHLVSVTHEKHEAPDNRLFGYVEKLPYHAFLAVPGYQVEGTVHLLREEEPDPVAVLAKSVNTFFPVTQAQLSQVLSGDVVEAIPVVMVNKKSLSLFHIADEPALNGY